MLNGGFRVRAARRRGKALVVLTTSDEHDTLTLQTELAGFLNLAAHRIE